MQNIDVAGNINFSFLHYIELNVYAQSHMIALCFVKAVNEGVMRRTSLNFVLYVKFCYQF